jgi:hypothetical protein
MLNKRTSSSLIAHNRVGGGLSRSLTRLHPLFPAKREKNRDFYEIGGSGAIETENNAVVTGLPARIPYSREQGIILAEHGKLAREQGFLPARIEAIAP